MKLNASVWGWMWVYEGICGLYDEVYKAFVSTISSYVFISSYPPNREREFQVYLLYWVSLHTREFESSSLPSLSTHITPIYNILLTYLCSFFSKFTNSKSFLFVFLVFEFFKYFNYPVLHSGVNFGMKIQIWLVVAIKGFTHFWLLRKNKCIFIIK